MALTLNNYVGFETQGAEEAESVTGSPSYPTTAPRTGDAHLSLPDGAQYRVPWVASGITDAGGGYVIGFAFQPLDKTPASASNIIRPNEDTGGPAFFLQLDTNGDLLVKDEAGSLIRTIDDPFSESAYTYVEVYFQHSDPGIIEVFINGVSQGSDSGNDLTSGGTLDTIRLTGASDTTSRFDDVYILSGATSSDNYGNFAVKAFQSTDVGDTDQGDALADGTWALVSEVPFNAGTSNDASYVDTGNLTGSTITDGGDRPGPSGDGDVTGATIKGAKYIGNFKRTSGGGRTHTILHGNNVDGVTATADLELTVDYIIYEVLSEAAGIVPTASEFFQQGFSKSATAGQDIFCGDQIAMLGYVPAAVGANPKGPLGHPLHGPFGGPV